MNRPVDLQSARIDAEAADWLVRRGEPGTPADDDAFVRWLAQDPRHGEVYDELAAVLEDVGHVPDVADHAAPARPRGRRWLAAGAAIAASLGGFVVVPQMMAPPVVTFATGIGEVRTVTLADGSRVSLGADARIGVQMHEGERDLTLEKGEAFFDIAHDRSRPFVVTAGGARVTVLGTRFEVRKGTAGVSVAVEEGRVQVADTQAFTLRPAPSRVLVPGQRTLVQARARYIAVEGAPPPVETLAAGQVAAWRSGRLSYNDVPLAEVVADINRYHRAAVALAGSEVGELRVTASFAVGEAGQFLSALAETLPVTVRQGEDHSVVVAARDTAQK